MAKTQVERTKVSDEKRGVMAKSYKLKIELVEAIAALASERGIPQNQVIEEAIELYISRI